MPMEDSASRSRHTYRGNIANSWKQLMLPFGQTGDWRGRHFQTILMGHTRWPTQGSHLDNNNNHPLVIGGDTSDGIRTIIGTHNGHISNWKALFTSLGYPRTTEVDSEIILRMALDAVIDASIAKSALVRLLSRCKGQMSAVMILLSEPGRIIVVKGNKPLEFLYNKKRDVLLYASELDFMSDILLQEDGWSAVDVRPMSVVAFECGRLGR